MDTNPDPKRIAPHRRRGRTAMSDTAVHISSLIVHSQPERARTIARRLRALRGVDVHGGVEAGKLVVTLETATEAKIVERLNAIQALDGVLAATLVYHHHEPTEQRG
jgi:nitrate reductase NapD